MHLVSLLGTVVWVLCVQLAAWATGRRLFTLAVRRGTPIDDGATRTLLSAALGFIALAYGAFLLAALRLLYGPVLVVVVLALAALGVFELIRTPRWPRFRPALADAPLIGGLLFAAAFLPAALHPVLAPDDGVYHLNLPRFYLQHHGLAPWPFNLFANMPHAVELLYTLPMATGDFTAAKVLNLSFVFWTLVGLASFARAHVGRLGAGVAVLLYLSGLNVQWHLGLGYVEPAIGMFLLGATLAFLAFRETRNTGFLWVLGACCGMAYGSKYAVWPAASVLVAAALGASLWSGETVGRRMRLCAATLTLPAALAAPWLAKNALFTGNPLYPNLPHLLDGAFWSEIQAFHLLKSQAFAGGAEKGLLSYVLLPVNLVLKDRFFFFAPAFSASLMALFVLGLVLAPRFKPDWRVLQVISLGGFLGWALSVQQGRFLVAWAPVMALSACVVLTLIRSKERLLAGVAVIVVAGGVVQRWAQPYETWRVADVLTTPRAELVSRNVGYRLCQFLNRTVPPQGKVLGLWENHLFFLERAYDADSAFEAPSGLAWLRSFDDAGAFARHLVAAGFTHVVVAKAPADGYLENRLPFDLIDDRLYPKSRLDRDRILVQTLVADHLERLHEDRASIVYRIKGSPGG